MIADTVKLFIETIDYAFVASADETGTPHLATGSAPQVPDPRHLVFEAWFCPTTRRNVAHNPRVAVAVIAASGTGYQFGGTVEKIVDTALLNGYAPELEVPGMPQVQSRLVVRVDQVMEFSGGAHTDQPLGAGR
jgi:uncharacterized protein